MNWLQGFADRIEHDVPLGRMTWFGIGGRARYLFRPSDVDELARFMQRAVSTSTCVRVLGSGANVLIRDDGFDGVVVRLDSAEFKRVEWLEDGLIAGGGVDLMPLSKWSCAEGWSGLEAMAGIPATVGGATRMNAGGRFGSFGDVVRKATLLADDGSVETLTREKLGFGYRKSNLGGRIVLAVELALDRCTPSESRSRYADLFEIKTASQPLSAHSAGCVFKNPDGCSAGALIDRAGLKGHAYGSAQVSNQHANFIVTSGRARSSDVMCLIDVVRDRVARQFGTELELEVDIW